MRMHGYTDAMVHAQLYTAMGVPIIALMFAMVANFSLVCCERRFKLSKQARLRRSWSCG